MRIIINVKKEKITGGNISINALHFSLSPTALENR